MAREGVLAEGTPSSVLSKPQPTGTCLILQQTWPVAGQVASRCPPYHRHGCDEHLFGSLALFPRGRVLGLTVAGGWGVVGKGTDMQIGSFCYEQSSRVQGSVCESLPGHFLVCGLGQVTCPLSASALSPVNRNNVTCLQDCSLT